jgi:hypothetical protein
MAFAAFGGKRGILSGVHVVPLIDILLVLLVIFLIIPHRQMGINRLWSVRNCPFVWKGFSLFALNALRFCKVIARWSFMRWPRFSISCIPPAPPRSAC